MKVESDGNLSIGLWGSGDIVIDPIIDRIPLLLYFQLSYFLTCVFSL